MFEETSPDKTIQWRLDQVPPSLLTIRNLSKDFESINIFKNVSFTVEKGETIGLYGKSGSGKTTIGRCIIGLEKPTNGEIIINGKNMLSMNKKEISKIRFKVQMIFQHPETSLNPRMKALDSIIEPLLVTKKLAKKDLIETAQDLMNLVGLRMEQMERYPNQLSGGEIQRIVLARILSLNPDFVVADEPTSMLDVSVQAQILRLMEKIQSEKGIAYLLISHDIEILKALCDRIAYLANGTIENIENIKNVLITA
jgi:peptide/nickel transport system ATP-binding protein